MMTQGNYQSSSMHLFQKRATLPVGSFAGSVSNCCRAIYVFLQQFRYHGFNMPWTAITGLLMRSPSTSTHQSTLGKTLLQRDPLQIWTFHVCFKDAITQHSFLMWLAHLEKLPTRARLARWVSISPNLVAFAINILRKEIICFFVVSGLGIYGTLACSEWPIVTSASILDNFLPMAVFSRQHFTDPSKELGVLSHCLLYLPIWSERNKRLHDNISTPPTIVFNQLDRFIRDAILFKRHQIQNCSLLQHWISSE
ncbi:hypothetical protein F2Q70_00014998 [Brassica cretica]|uniref:Reverse transcriptase zinc-binding domain-containing protein n=1 Tax=Brassica cretica TaxID=69181 RepID=A0A8S9HYI8_BRACR|nr:hypothetical protein F2Q70_00014998 [Brassica cretica]KAF2596059.1 hypothetical protein F2Q68_00008088 [Brassica cretica]